jgi:hypothetical protein
MEERSSEGARWHYPAPFEISIRTTFEISSNPECSNALSSVESLINLFNGSFDANLSRYREIHFLKQLAPIDLTVPET